MPKKTRAAPTKPARLSVTPAVVHLVRLYLAGYRFQLHEYREPRWVRHFGVVVPPPSRTSRRGQVVAARRIANLRSVLIAAGIEIDNGCAVTPPGPEGWAIRAFGPRVETYGPKPTITVASLRARIRRNRKQP